MLTDLPPLGIALDVPGGALQVLDQGSGPPVVLLHGANGSMRDWVAGPLGAIAARARTLVFDRPGLGHSTRPEGGEDIFVQARMLAAGAAACGAARPVVVGHSFGGAVALAWALDMPDRIAGLVVLSTPSHPWPGPLESEYRLMADPVTGVVYSWMRRQVATQTMVEAQVRAIFAPDPMPADYLDAGGVGLALDAGRMHRNARDIAALRDTLRAMVPRYPGLRLPVEIIHGQADRIVWPDIHSVPLADAVPGSSLTLLPGTGHMPHHARPDALMAALGRILP